MGKYFDKLVKMNEALDKEMLEKGIVNTEINANDKTVKDDKTNIVKEDGENTIEISKDSLTDDQKKEILLDKGVDQKAVDNLKSSDALDGALTAAMANDVKQESGSGRDPLVDYLQEHANVRSENDCVTPELAVDMVSDILKIGHPYHIKDKLGPTRHFMKYGKSKYTFVIVRRTDKNMVIYKDDEPGEFYALDSNLTNEEFFKQIAGFIRKLGADKGLCESSLDNSDVSEEVVVRIDDDDLDMHGYLKSDDGLDVRELEWTDDIKAAKAFQHEELGQNAIEAICTKFHYDPNTFKTISLDPRADEPYEDDEENNDNFGENWVSIDPMHPSATTLP